MTTCSNELICGPQVVALQSDKWLCLSRVKLSPEGERVQGGQIDHTGDYSEAGIELANEGRGIWTVGALRFWQRHCEDRQTVVYAVSVRHARNLVAVFNSTGIPTGLLLGDTPTEERAWLIDRFQVGAIRVLVNVAVATEGFDLPDAACIVLTRPTMSLSLYLQMVGRGLRPKGDEDCMILDLAGNSLRHGLPEEGREWSLQPRGDQPSGESWEIWCPGCESLSPAGSHQCTSCRASRVPGSGVRGRGSGERETTASSLAGKEESSRKEDNSGQGKDGPAGAIAQGGNGR